jgi:hypothetical protein
MANLKLNWCLDPQTKTAATRFPLPIKASSPASQYAGRNFNPVSWNKRVLAQHWPQTPFKSSPDNIICAFQADDHLEALALVISWGTMARSQKSIYQEHDRSDIHGALKACAESIITTQKIDDAWQILTGNSPGELGWSAVITSKCLHFLARSLGFVDNPPVALDNGVLRQKVWPVFKQGAAAQGMQLDPNWKGNDFGTYTRYMTAVLVWANQRQWTTTEMEATIFAEYR